MSAAHGDDPAHGDRGARDPVRRLLLSGAGAALAARLAPALGQAPATAQGERYRLVPRSPDGIGKAYMGREIAAVMGWQGAGWLERGLREREERGEVLLRELRLAPGLQVADVGAGTGWHARRIAPLVSPGGRVWAVDVQPEMIRLLRRLVEQAGIDNVEPVLGTVQDVRLAPGTIDLALMVDVYHELEYPYEVVESIVAALRPGGRLAYVEYRAEDPSVPIKPAHKMSLEQIRREAGAHALELDRIVDALPWQHLAIFRKAVGAPPRR